MGSENIIEEYFVCSAIHEDIPELVRMKLGLQEHMEKANSLILRYTEEWKRGLSATFGKLLNDSNVTVIKAVTNKDKKTVGMMVGTVNEHPQFTIERSGKIDDVWVDIDHRNKGLASQMLSDLLSRFTEKGIKHITLNYVVNNIEAEQTWRALGFNPAITNCVTIMKD